MALWARTVRAIRARGNRSEDHTADWAKPSVGSPDLRVHGQVKDLGLRSEVSIVSVTLDFAVNRMRSDLESGQAGETAEDY